MMGQELYWIYAFNVIVNSFLSFFTTIVLVEICIRLLRINHPRVKCIGYFLAPSKICLDFFLYHYSNWALLHGVNPIAETGTRNLSLMINPFAGIQFSMQDGKTFSLADMIALSMGLSWIRMVVLIAIMGVVIGFIAYGVRVIREKRYVGLIVRLSLPFARSIVNLPLASWLKKRQVRLAVTSFVDAPCIAGKTILFPSALINNLSAEEYEAIIAHEMAHLQWKDCSLRLVYSIVATVFWWIPTSGLQRRIEEMQEMAADLMIHRFGISKIALAEAVVKTAKARGVPSKLVFSFVGRRSSFRKRMEMILQEPMKQALGCKAMQYGLLGLSLFSILFGKLWIF
jgi:beta-lactamase regulating signal transducer with metallopeptidase domain